MVGRFDEPMRSIGEVAESLDLPQHVLRFWETRFKEIDPVKRAGGRRLYRQRDVDIVIAIRHLLYGEGYTIKGVQRILKEQGVEAVLADVERRMNGDEETITPNSAAPTIDPSARDELEAEPDRDAVDSEPDELGHPSATPSIPLLVAEPTTPAAEEPAPPHDFRSLDDQDARLLRAALAEIEECKRLLRLTER